MCCSRALCVVLAIAIGQTTALAQQESAPEQTHLEILLTTAAGLTETARASMMSEAAALWRSQGMVIHWLPATARRPVSPTLLRVLVVERRQSTAHAGDAFTVGELLRPLTGHPVAMVSIESAQRLVASVRGRFGYELVAVDHRRLGLVLGRALAHEIGHYLLDTNTHARHGLMRPQFNALEFTDLRDGIFALDRDASAWLKSRLDTDTTFTHQGEQFAYAR